MAKKTFDEEIASLKNRKDKDNYFKERIIWGRDICASGLKMLPTIYLIFPGVIMLLCGFPTLLFGLFFKPILTLLYKSKFASLKKHYPEQFKHYIIDEKRQNEYYKQYAHERMFQS